MDKNFDILVPYNQKAEAIRAFVNCICLNYGIKVLDLKESDILDKNNIPVEKVYITMFRR